MGKINVCISTDDNYAKHCAVVMKSAVENALPEDDLHFFILDGGISGENISRLKGITQNVEIVEIDKTIFEPFEAAVSKMWALPTLFRLKMPSLLKNLDKVIYLDCDIVVNASLAKLFNLNIDDYSIAAVNDYASEVSAKRLSMKGKKYFNAGAILVNLKAWRKKDIEAKLLDYLEKNSDKMKFADQDIMNPVLEGEVLYLEQGFNYIVPSAFQTKKDVKWWDENRENITIIHYAGQKPWEIYYKNTLKDEYWKYYKMTPWQKNEPYEAFKKAQDFANFKPFLILRFIKRYPFFMFSKRFFEFLRFFK